MDDQNKDFRILIIDDNTEIHKDFIKTLSSIKGQDKLSNLETQLFDNAPTNVPNIILPKFQIDTATQGQQGVQMIADAINQKKPYALAFVDIRMPPGWDGVETIKHIWELDKDIQIVICTAYSDYSWEETITELGETDNLLILKKPFDQTAVRQLAYALTRKWRLMHEARNYTATLENTIQKRTEELHHQATHDSLTGLPNRFLLEVTLNQAIEESKRKNTNLAVLFFDLDRFKLVNDSLSHVAGDQLLMIISARIKASTRTSDTLCRLGGDEFVLIARDCKPEEATLIALKILEAVQHPVMIGNHEVKTTTSVGISICPENGSKIEELIRHADFAMYKSKELGGNQFQFYNEEMSKSITQTITLENELRHAIINNELFLVFQPQYDLKNNKIEAVEALVRWSHPTKGILLPIDFVPLAEENGLIIPLSDWVIDAACKQNKLWQEQGYPPIRIAINVTNRQIKQIDFVDKIEQTLRKYALDPQFLEIELTENTIINNSNVRKILTRLKKIGIFVAVDNFGTGYSTLNYLRSVPLDRLKIDRSFIQNILINQSDEVIIQAIIAMAQGLNLEVLAEGVETKKQVQFLQNLRCKEVQGFYFSQPLTAQETTKLFEENINIKEMLKED